MLHTSMRLSRRLLLSLSALTVAAVGLARPAQAKPRPECAADLEGTA